MGAADWAWLMRWTPSRRRLAVKPICAGRAGWVSPLRQPEVAGVVDRGLASQPVVVVATITSAERLGRRLGGPCAGDPAKHDEPGCLWCALRQAAGAGPRPLADSPGRRPVWKAEPG